MKRPFLILFLIYVQTLWSGAFSAVICEKGDIYCVTENLIAKCHQEDIATFSYCPEETPVCEKNKCVNNSTEITVPPTTENPTTDHPTKEPPTTEHPKPKCTRIGEFYPEAGDCRKYNYCAKKGQQVSFTCLAGKIWSQNLGLCAPSAPCYVYTSSGLCKGKAGQSVAYPPNPSFYAECPTDSSVPEIKMCANTFEKFVNGQCQMQCGRAGRFPHSDKKKYYVCTKTIIGFTLNVEDCPEGTKFCRMKLVCKPDDKNSHEENESKEEEEKEEEGHSGENGCGHHEEGAEEHVSEESEEHVSEES